MNKKEVRNSNKLNSDAQNKNVNFYFISYLMIVKLVLII